MKLTEKINQEIQLKRAGKKYVLLEAGWDRKEEMAGVNGWAEPYTFPPFFPFWIASTTRF